MSEFSYAIRALTRSPRFACVAILSLALGIGANAAIYSLIRAVLLEPLPVPAPEELVAVGWNSRGVRTRGVLQINSTSYRDEPSGANYSSNFSYALYRAFQQVAGSELFAFSYAANDVNASIAGQSVAASSLLVSGNYFSALGVRTVMGRPLDPQDDQPGATPVGVLTYDFWQRVFGGDPSVLLRTIRLNGSAVTIVGVTTHGFYGMSTGGPFFKPTDVLLPLSVQPLVYTRSLPRSLLAADDRWWVQVMARVKTPAAMPGLENAMNAAFRSTLAASSMPALREASAGEVRLLPAPRGLDSWTRSMRQPLLILGIVVGIVLLIACVNIGNLLLVRGVARQKELAVRLALGSSQWRLMRGVLVESAVLAAAGGALGMILGIWGARAVFASMIAGSTRTAIDIGIDNQLLGATLAATAIALLLSALPALRTVRRAIAPTMKHVSAGANLPDLRAGRMLMAAQVGISVPLVVGAALFLQTVYNLGQVDLGFNPERLLIFRVDPSLNAYDADRIERLYGELVQRLGAIPDIDSAAVTDIVPISRLQNNWTFVVPGSAPTNVKFARVGPAYFETLGIRAVAGRTIGVQDHSRAPRVAVITRSAARALFGDDPALGRTLTMQSDQPADFEVVGVVNDSRYTSPRDAMPPTIYLPFAQTTVGRLGPMNVILRSSVPMARLGELVREAMASVDPSVPVTDLRTQINQINETLGTERTFMRLLLAFGAFALLLASIGVHGVTAYSVVRRTSEIAVRVALGASQRDVAWLILRQVIGITIAGLAIGVPVALASARLIRTSLYGVEPVDPLSVIGAAITIVMVAVIAGVFPARRAARLDPLTALRQD